MSKSKALIRSLIFLPLIFFIFFQMFFPLFFPSAFNRRMTLLVSSLIALAICSIIWMVLVYFPGRTISKILRIALISGVISFLLGFVGPILFSPGANQGPLLGIFITGPLGFIAGLVAGIVFRHSKRKDQIEPAVLLYVPLKFRSLVVRFPSDSLETQTLCPLRLLSVNNKS